MLAFFKKIMYTTKVLKREQKIKLKWLIGQGVKTPPSHGGNRGSIPLLAVKKKALEEILVLFCSYIGKFSVRTSYMRTNAPR